MVDFGVPGVLEGAPAGAPGAEVPAGAAIGLELSSEPDDPQPMTAKATKATARNPRNFTSLEATQPVLVENGVSVCRKGGMEQATPIILGGSMPIEAH